MFPYKAAKMVNVGLTCRTLFPKSITVIDTLYKLNNYIVLWFVFTCPPIVSCSHGGGFLEYVIDSRTSVAIMSVSVVPLWGG